MSSSITNFLNTFLSNTESSASTSKPELNSILSRVQNLQTDRDKLLQELEFAKQKVEKPTEGKPVEMKQCLDTVIAKWLDESVENDANRTNFKQERRAGFDSAL